MSPASWQKGPAEIETEVRFIRKLHNGSFLILEGDTDLRFWWPRVAQPVCELVQGDGKPNVIGALQRLDNGGFRGALGLVDDDFDRVEHRSSASPNLIATPDHDLETMLLQSSALPRVLSELCERDMIRQFEDQAGQDVRGALLERGLEFGRLRWLALREQWQGSFDQLRPTQRFVNKQTWEVDRDALHAVAVQSGLGRQTDDLRSKLASLPDAPPWSICHGHDLIELLRIGLHGVLGRPERRIGAGEIASRLRGSYQDADLHGSLLAGSIRDWEARNPPYRILPSRNAVARS